MQFRHLYFCVSFGRWRHAIGLALAFAAGIIPASAGASPKEAGVWINDVGDGAVKIEPCGDKLCGRIVWLKNPLNDQGVPKHDRFNPDESQRNRPICGLPVLGALEAMPEGGFDNGWVYDPKEGKSYSVAVIAQGPGELSVTGYKGVKFLGKTFTWTRAKVELPSCNAQPAAAKPSGDTAASGASAGAAGAATAAPMKAKKMPEAQSAPVKPVKEVEVAPTETETKPAKPAAAKIVEPAATSQPSAEALPAGDKPVTVTKKAKPEVAKTAPATSEQAVKTGAANTAAPKKKPKPETAAAKAASTEATSDSAAPKLVKKKVVAKDGTANAPKKAEKEVLPWATSQ